ncbi:hypothetical protein Pla111_04400 [Botrimarina hoheduenensis]|uniref:Uncharacterized protein n=1 Tax=Botrimarina hoheduenensis TaxID=2528000 RepID=A0A5C5WF25_9BACT|nr:hypothetical protein Pla111_04400 [Botrimarina hoheduenensis]
MAPQNPVLKGAAFREHGHAALRSPTRPNDGAGRPLASNERTTGTAEKTLNLKLALVAGAFQSNI